MGVGGIPSDYLVSTQLQLWLFCCWGCGCCWAVTIQFNAKFITGTFVQKLRPHSIVLNISSHKTNWI